MNIVFRTDASIRLGSGHVMRCLALADRMRKEGAEIHFLCSKLPGHMGETISGRGYELHFVPPLEQDADTCWRQDAERAAEILQGLNTAIDWLVVDHYMLDYRWESMLQGSSKRIMVIDDLANRKHVCDLILDQNIHGNLQERYDALVPGGCRKLLGPRYALLREEFAGGGRKERSCETPVRRILLFFGGSDPGNETGRVLDILSALSCRIDIDVVIGSINPHREQIEARCQTMPNATLHIQAGNMAELLEKADMAIGAGGTICWERCAAGIPTLAWPVAENQVEQLKSLAGLGAVYLPEEESVRTVDGLVLHIQALMTNPALRRHMAEQAVSLCDGGGVERVRDALCVKEISVRRANASDIRNIYRWRNDPSIRRHCGNPRQIAWKEHARWFEESLQRTDRLLFVGECNTLPAGVVRFDLLEGGAAEVSLYLAPELVGKGYGRALLEAGERELHRHHPDTGEIRAQVLVENTASGKLFRSAGYRRIREMFVKRTKV